MGFRWGWIVATVAGLALAAPANATRLETFTTTSAYVDPSKQNFNHPPGTDPGRPNALRVNVLLPDGYDGKRRFPVLYLLHGHGDAYDSWMSPQQGQLTSVAKGFPGIVVMPEGARGWYTNWWNGGRRGAPAWERYHLDELIPLIQSRYRILGGRRWHAIAGLSMGGEGAMYYAEQRPGYFGSAASFSGVLNLERPEWPTGFDTQGEKHTDVFGDPQAQQFYWAGHSPTALVESLRNTRVFVAVGDGTPKPGEVSKYFGALSEADLHQHANDFVIAARAQQVDVTYDQRQGIHDWPYWRQHLADALKWGFFGPVAQHPLEWAYTTVAQSSRAWGFRFEFVKPPEAVETFRLEGNRLLGDGAGTVSVRTPGGAVFSAKLPFNVAVPSAPRNRLRDQRLQRRRGRR
jgi:S-formylglutathione hydrolase FrmB